MSRGFIPYSISYRRYTQMQEKNNATCSICGSEYYVCLSCKDKMKLHPWKTYCCSPSHFQVAQVVRGFSNGVYNKEELKSKLLNVDLSDLDSYKEHIKAIIKDALKEDEVVNVEVKDEFYFAEEVETEEVKEVVFEKPIYSRKRNYRMEIE